MKFLTIAMKDLKEIIRDKKGLTFILIFPIILLIVIGLFVGAGQGFRPHDIAVINYDQGSILTNGSTVNYGNTLTENLKDVKYNNSNVHLFNVVTTSMSNANQLLNEDKIDAELIIPQNFSDAMVAMTENTALTITDPSSSSATANATSTLIIRGNMQYNDFGITQSILTGELNEYQDQVIIQTQTAILGNSIAEPTDYVNSLVESTDSAQNFTTSYFITPSIIIFSMLILAIIVAICFSREEEKGSLSRLKLSGIRVFDLIFGGIIAWTLILIIQLLLLLVAAIAVGFWQDSVNSILLILLIGIIGGIASISLGIVIAALTRNSRQAFGLGIIFIIPITVLAVFQLPQKVFKIGSFNFQIYNFLPWTHVFNAFQAILAFGEGWNGVSHEILLAVILTLVLFIVSVGIYSISKLSEY